METNAIHEVERFLLLQRALIRAIESKVPERRLGDALSELPRKGVVTVGTDQWEYFRHGSGVLFKNKESGVVVDAHRRVDQPELFDPWRLGAYFASLGRRGSKLVERAIGCRRMSIDRALEQLFVRWIKSDRIVRDGSFYRFP